MLTFFGGFVDLASLDNITNAVKGKSAIDAEIVNVAKTKIFYQFYELFFVDIYFMKPEKVIDPCVFP